MILCGLTLTSRTLRPPTDNPAFIFSHPDGTEIEITVADLQRLPRTVVSNCFIVSTGHGTSGPFEFAGATLLDVVHSQLSAGQTWSEVEVISADGFGNRVFGQRVTSSRSDRSHFIELYAGWLSDEPDSGVGANDCAYRKR